MKLEGLMESQSTFCFLVYSRRNSISCITPCHAIVWPTTPYKVSLVLLLLQIGIQRSGSNEVNFYIWTYDWNFIHCFIMTVKLGKRKASRSFFWASNSSYSFARLYEISFPSFFSVHETNSLGYLSQCWLFSIMLCLYWFIRRCNCSKLQPFPRTAHELHTHWEEQRGVAHTKADVYCLPLSPPLLSP